jgi:hypothetical protein
MALYVVYSYQFSPKTDNQVKLFSEYESQDEIWEKKQEIFGELFTSDIVFTYRSHTHSHEVLFNEANLILLKLANNKKIVQEFAFKTKKLEHNPSCNILIDNRKDIQNIYIENSSYAFSDTSVTARILENTFNKYLSESGLIVAITQRYKTQEFWDIIDTADNGVKMVRFSLQYPNLPSVRQKMGDMLAEASKQIKSKETKLEFNAGEGESLDITKQNEKVVEMVEASAATGKKITLRLNGYRAYREVGSTVEEVEIDNIEASLTPDLLNSASQKIISIINKFKK